MNTRLPRILLNCLLWLAVTCVYAESPIAIINNLDQAVDLNPYIETIEDPSHEYTLADIQAGKYNHLWQRNKERYFIGHNLKSWYWFRVTLMWNKDQYDSAILTIKTPPSMLYQITLQIPMGASSYRTELTGQLEPYINREMHDQLSAFHLGLIPHAPLTVFGLINNCDGAAPAILPLSLMTEKSYAESSIHTMGILIAFYAIMGSLLLYNSCLFLMLRQPVYGLYVLFLACATLASSVIDGSYMRWLFPTSPLPAYRLSLFNANFLCMVYLCFVVHALDKIKFWPRFNVVFYFLLTTGAITLVHNAFTQDYYLANLLVQGYSCVLMPVTLILIVFALYHGVPTAGYLLIAEIMTLAGGTSFMLMMQGIIPINEITFWGIHWGFAGEALLLSLAVAARTNIAIQEKLKAQELAYHNERKALAALETATQIKNQFLTTVSHELRTPLNSIIGFSNVLLEDRHIQGNHREYSQTILNNGKQLLAVVNDVLNLSLIDGNRLTITQRIVNLPMLVQEIEVKYRLIAHKNGVVFDVVLDKALDKILDKDRPLLIEIDAEHLVQVLKQLLNNAFKFTHQGRVTLRVSAVKASARGAKENQRPSLKFTLTDTGIGIAADKLTQVFEPFTQVDSSNTRRYSGTGVGLFIAKAVTEKMGGTLSVESTLDVGTRFDLVLPYSAEKEFADEQSHPAAISQKPKLCGRVLYAEDNLDNQQLVQLLVNATGAELTLAANGREAIDAVNNAESPFDLVLMDLQMPVMDGYEATANLKRNGCSTPVVACSASALATIASSRDVVFEGYLGKPIDKMQLYAVLAEYLATAGIS